MPRKGEYKAIPPTPPVGADVDVPDSDPRDDLLLVALMQGASYRQAAQTSGYSERTVERRMQDPKFKRRVTAMRAQQQQRSLAILASAVPIGLQALTLAASGWETIPYTDEHGVQRERRLPVPWTARIQAASKLVELGVGSLARVQVEVSDAPDRSEVEDALSDKLQQYRDQAPPALRLLLGGDEASEPIDATATEQAQPAPAPTRRKRA